MIRNGEQRDIPRLAAIFRQMHEHHMRIAPDSYTMPFEGYFELEMRSYLSDEGMTVLVCERDGEAAAYAALRVYDRESAGRVPLRILYIEHFAVAEEHRRCGLGTELFDAVRELAAEKQCGCIQLGAAAANTEALGFYQKQGMTPRTIKMEIKL